MVLGALSWLFAVPLSYPGARLLSDVVGNELLNLPLEFSYSIEGMVLWLVIALIISAVASLWPALSAARVSVREALAYE
jgi:ABC-type lipoprotein release transport system permease subunit